MRPTLIFLCFSLVAGACVVEDRPVNPGDGGVDGGECPPCPNAEEPVCNDGTCVECTQDSNELCGDETPLCDDPGTFTCVECVSDADCDDPTLAKCDDELKECVRCDDDRQCDNVEGFLGTANACNTENGECVDCTPESEETSCPGDPVWFVCDPDTNTCTETPAGSRSVCESCTLDSECGDEDGTPSVDHRCVPMFYPTIDTRFPDDETGFCLKTTDGGCQRPYSVTLFQRQSLTGPPLEDYCGVEESLTTCPAVNALLDDDVCGDDGDCQEGGICRQVGSLVPDRCTYRCGLPAQCPSAAPADTCGASGSGGDNYCGG